MNIRERRQARQNMPWVVHRRSKPAAVATDDRDRGWKIGDKVRIDGNCCGHNFDLGEIVEVIAIAKCSNGELIYDRDGSSGYKWAIYKDDGELVS